MLTMRNSKSDIWHICEPKNKKRSATYRGAKKIASLYGCDEIGDNTSLGFATEDDWGVTLIFKKIGGRWVDVRRLDINWIKPRII